MSNYIKKFVIDDRRRRLASILARDSNMTHSDRDGQAAWRRSKHHKCRYHPAKANGPAVHLQFGQRRLALLFKQSVD